MTNEYYDAFQSLREKHTFRGEQWFGERQRLVEKYSWAVPNEEVLTYLAEFDEITEVGAGSGYWANCIDGAGGSVRATDLDPPEDTYIPVEQAGWTDLLGEIADVPVLLVWPPYDEGVAAGVARQRPPHILYIGEGRGGCTAEAEFFDILEREYGLVAKVDIPSYQGVNDQFFHYVRKV